MVFISSARDKNRSTDKTTNICEGFPSYSFWRKCFHDSILERSNLRNETRIVVFTNSITRGCYTYFAACYIYQIKGINLAITENRFSFCFITSLRNILTSKHNRLTCRSTSCEILSSIFSSFSFAISVRVCFFTLSFYYLFCLCLSL